MGLTWRAGGGSGVLPVAAGTPLGGYGSRTARASGVLRPLEVNVLAVSSGGGTAVVIALDLLSVDADWVADLRARVAHRHGVGPECVLVAASHTHAGPAGFRRVGVVHRVPDDDAAVLRRGVLDAASDAVDRAMAERADVVLRVGTGESVVGANRSDPSLPVDRRLTRLDATTPDGRLVAVLWHHTCHATVLGPDSTWVSPDLPGEVRARLRDGTRPNLPVLFLNGAAGDVSTRFTRRDQTPAELGRLAAVLADELPHPVHDLAPAVPVGVLGACRLPAATEAPEVVRGRLAAARASLEAAGTATAGRERRVLETAVVGLEKRLARTSAATDVDAPPEPLVAALQAVDLGGLVLVAIPGEMYSADGAHLRDALQAARAADGSGSGAGPSCLALPVGYAGDYLGYLPPAGAPAGYESDSAVVAAGAGDLLVSAARDLVAGVRR